MQEHLITSFTKNRSLLDVSLEISEGLPGTNVTLYNKCCFQPGNVVSHNPKEENYIKVKTPFEVYRQHVSWCSATYLHSKLYEQKAPTAETNIQGDQVLKQWFRSFAGASLHYSFQTSACVTLTPSSLLPPEHIAPNQADRGGFTGSTQSAIIFLLCPPMSFNQDQV